MTLSMELIATLRCPITHEALRLATQDEVDRAQGASKTSEGWEEGLVSVQSFQFYPVENGFPILLKDRSVRLEAD